MKSFNPLERTIAKTLDRFPQIKQVAKSTYQRLNYWYYGDRNFSLALHPRVKISTPWQWCNVEETKGELFFGYYDKSPWSSDMSKFICHRLQSDRQVEIIIYDRYKQTVEVVATSKTWSSQQGTMVQWLSNCDDKQIIFNDLVEGKLAARIISLATKTEDMIPFPIQTLHPNGKEALTLNYKRLARLRPEYGYEVDASNFSDDLPLTEDGIWHVDLETGKGKLIISLQDLIAYQSRPEMTAAEHKVNHIMYSPQGSKFVFMHRWLSERGKLSRLYVSDSDGSNLQLLLDEGMISHYSWYDEAYLLAWARTKAAGDRYYLIDVTNGKWQITGKEVLDIYGDGHPSFSPNRRWIVTDTYPDRSRQQHLLLCDCQTQKTLELGRFFAPLKYSAGQRCDLHPRWSSDGNIISIDATYEGKRYSYFIDIAAIVND
ncbi:hypothetical protein [Myxosarcina sp. GI1]|uniref:hypothetical protein n=1 Tax=Myxosarcina sp. GI1 TaxID=1541065 RepID=UPI00055D47AA|nr:hypothetical protein [Myxosarcina sp. GI1]